MSVEFLITGAKNAIASLNRVRPESTPIDIAPWNPAAAGPAPAQAQLLDCHDLDGQASSSDDDTCAVPDRQLSAGDPQLISTCMARDPGSQYFNKFDQRLIFLFREGPMTAHRLDAPVSFGTCAGESHQFLLFWLEGAVCIAQPLHSHLFICFTMTVRLLMHSH